MLQRCLLVMPADDRTCIDEVDSIIRGTSCSTVDNAKSYFTIPHGRYKILQHVPTLHNHISNCFNQKNNNEYVYHTVFNIDTHIPLLVLKKVYISEI